MTKPKVNGISGPVHLLPAVTVSELRPDTNTGEHAVSYIRQRVAEMMDQNGGVLNPSYLLDLLSDVGQYFRSPLGVDDNIQIINLSTFAIRTKRWGSAQLLRFDPLTDAGLDFKPWDSLDTLEKKAAALNNMKAKLVIAQAKKSLEDLFVFKGFSHEQGTIKSVTLQLERTALDDTVAQPYNFKFIQKFEGWGVSYKTPENFGRVILGLCKDSTETNMNLKQALTAARQLGFDTKQKEFDTKQAELAARQLEFGAKQVEFEQRLAEFDAKREEFDARLEALELIIGDRQTGKTS